MSIKTLQVIYIQFPPDLMPYCSDTSDLLEKSIGGKFKSENMSESSLKVPASSFLFQMPLLKLQILSPASPKVSLLLLLPQYPLWNFLERVPLSCQHLKSLYNEQYIHMNKNKTKLSAKYNFFLHKHCIKSKRNKLNGLEMSAFFLDLSL